jgi:hypothetical protein
MAVQFLRKLRKNAEIKKNSLFLTRISHIYFSERTVSGGTQCYNKPSQLLNLVSHELLAFSCNFAFYSYNNYFS